MIVMMGIFSFVVTGKRSLWFLEIRSGKGIQLGSEEVYSGKSNV